MIICIPSESNCGLQDNIGYHFGRVEYYTIYNDDSEEVIVIKNTSTHKGGKKLPAELLRDLNVNIMLCGSIGRKAIQLFEEFGVEVYAGAQGTVNDALKQFKGNKLKITTKKDACQEHKFRGESQGHLQNCE
jgi:predicted Fe-Mo cluster-binding NifX family protein